MNISKALFGLAVLAVVVAAPATPAPAAPAVSSPTTGTTPLLDEDPPPPPTRDECLEQEDARNSPGDLSGWHKDRYGWCARGEYEVPGRDATTGQELARLSVDFIIIGYGNNGARQVDYLVYIEDIRTSGPGVNWSLAQLETSLSGCNTAMNCPTTSRTAFVPDWRASNTFAATFTSPDVAGAGEQRVHAPIGLVLRFSTPTQPEWVWGTGVTVAQADIRFDSASYVGRARGAVFTGHRLVFSVDLRLANQRQSALHIQHALDKPQLTFPSWVGKSVPGKTEPITRMFNEAEKEANREHSRKLCRKYFGAWHGDLQNCDEFPFASTYEGSLTGPRDRGWGDRFSVRLIDADDNKYVGNELLEVRFYRALRVLDGDKFYVAVLQ